MTFESYADRIMSLNKYYHKQIEKLTKILHVSRVRKLKC